MRLCLIVRRPILRGRPALRLCYGQHFGGGSVAAGILPAGSVFRGVDVLTLLSVLRKIKAGL
jgi:hypothetical protein